MRETNPEVFIQKCFFILITLCFLMTVPTLGQYEIRWYTIDGGGGVSSGGQYIVRGTIGQADAGCMSGGDYELEGGFWSSVPFCIVDFYHYARFAEYWLETGSDLPADLYEDDTIDFFDLKLFADEWLYFCPYDWPLR